MNHIDFVIWIVGWGFLMGMQPIGGTWWNGIRQILMTIIWILVAIMLYGGW